MNKCKRRIKQEPLLVFVFVIVFVFVFGWLVPPYCSLMTPSAQFPADIVAGIPPLTALFFIPHINSTFCAMIHCTDRSINICHIKASERHQGRPDLPCTVSVLKVKQG